jgi:hypothetical protein
MAPEPDFDQFIADIVLHMAHSRRIPLKLAERVVRRLVGGARAEYRELGMPFGDDDAGFWRWILERPERPLMA